MAWNCGCRQPSCSGEGLFYEFASVGIHGIQFVSYYLEVCGLKFKNSERVPVPADFEAWTDDYTNLWRVFRFR